MSGADAAMVAAELSRGAAVLVHDGGSGLAAMMTPAAVSQGLLPRVTLASSRPAATHCQVQRRGAQHPDAVHAGDKLEGGGQADLVSCGRRPCLPHSRLWRPLPPAVRWRRWLQGAWSRGRRLALQSRDIARRGTGRR